MADIVETLTAELESAMRASESAAVALAAERETAETLRDAVRNGMRVRAALEAEIVALREQLAAAQSSQDISRATRPFAQPLTASHVIDTLALVTDTAVRTVRWNLTNSAIFAPLRDNAAAIDSVPLTQSFRLLSWLSEDVTDGFGHKRTRYAMLLGRYVSLERMLD